MADERLGDELPVAAGIVEVACVVAGLILEVEDGIVTNGGNEVGTVLEEAFNGSVEEVLGMILDDALAGARGVVAMLDDVELGVGGTVVLDETTEV